MRSAGEASVSPAPHIAMKARVVKGGWFFNGEMVAVGQTIDVPENIAGVTPEQWVANRVADGGLVEPVEPEQPKSPAPEAAVVVPTETATQPRASAKRK
jgi:hypothetical protein